MGDVKGVPYPKAVMVYVVFFSLSAMPFPTAISKRPWPVRGIKVDHVTLNRWVVKFAPLIAVQAQVRMRPTATFWRMDESYIKVKGNWTYLYRAVDRDDQTLDFALSVGSGGKSQRCVPFNQAWTTPLFFNSAG